MKKHLLTLSFSISTLLIFGQTQPNLFDFTQTNHVAVIQNNDSLPNPWAGGLNYAQVNSIDLNFDNVDDLAVFDRNTHQVETFIRFGNMYQYAPEYRTLFPQPNTWMILRDYNCDGKKDIFFNVGSDVRVWENTSSGSLSFTDVTNGPLQTLYSSSTVKSNLFISSGDVPGIADVDGDGDIDILTFENGGTIMEFHENRSNCGLDYVLKERCYGHFSESGLYREVSLNSCIPFKKKTLHQGSTILPIDLNGDAVIDLIMGNISYNSMGALYNGGDQDSAHFTSQDTTFPSYDTPINVMEFPAAFYEDVTFDGKADLIVSPAAQGEGGGDRQSVFVYQNTGTNASPQFQYLKDDFLQKQMIDLGKGAIPRLVDLNGDSLQDLVVANNSAFVSPTLSTHFYHYYINTGTKSQPRFTLTDTNLADISSNTGLDRGTIPAFGDLDGDGDFDMMVGDENGKLYYFKNSSATQPSFSFQYALSSVDVQNNAAPFLFDIDEDGDLDLLVGNEQGKVYYYTNSSATNPSFTLANSNFGGIDVKQSSYSGNSVPYAFKHNGTINLFVGSEGQGVFQYDSISTVTSLPSTVQVTLGTGTVVPPGADETPFGFLNKAGRNQFLVRASDMRAAGLDYGYLKSIAFDVTTNNNGLVYPKLSVRLKMTQDSVLNGFATGLTEVFESHSGFLLGQGWNAIDFFPFKHFLWDGTSNIIIEFCFSGMANSGNNATVKMTDVGYNCNAYGQYVDRNTGCTQTLKGVSQNRPNMMFFQVPAFRETSNYGRASRGAPAISDLNDDGFVDMILGNYGGGLYYYEGKKYEISLPENPVVEKGKLNVFPNPGTDVFTISLPNHSKSTLRVFDLTGRLVGQRNVSEKETTIDLSNQAKGIYLFVLQTSSGVMTQKVIRQ